MNSGEITGLLYTSNRAVRLRWEKGVISALEETRPPSGAEAWICPAALDLQVNGYAGVDFQQDGLTEGDLLRAATGLRAAGCGRFLLTLITDEWEQMLERIRHLRRLRLSSPALQRAIAGWHLEGPFLSSQAGFCGAHRPELMRDPSPKQVAALREATGADPVLLTLAPERPGALEAIREAVVSGMKVSLGHTDASSQVLRAAIAAGATGFTHFANACPQQLDRHDNILWRVLDTSGLTVSLIPDGYHVSPALFRLAHRVFNREAIYYTTDAVSAAGAGPGRYTVGPHQVDVGPDQIVRQPGKTNFAGSGLRPLDGAFRAGAILGQSWREVWDWLSVSPARFMGWPHGLGVGAPADVTLIEMNGGQPGRVRTWVRGEELSHPVRAKP